MDTLISSAVTTRLIDFARYHAPRDANPAAIVRGVCQGARDQAYRCLENADRLQETIELCAKHGFICNTEKNSRERQLSLAAQWLNIV